MPVIQKKITLAAGATSENLVSGSAFEFARTNQLLSVGVTASAEGAFVTIQSGADIVLEESEIAVKDGFPIVPDEMYYNDVSAPGDRLVIRLRNPTSGAVDVYSIVQVSGI